MARNWRQKNPVEAGKKIKLMVIQVANIKNDRLAKVEKQGYWIAKASDLFLPDVPKNERKRVRLVLTPLLRLVQIKSGDCWNIAQSLMEAALICGRAGHVSYVEGVWTRAEDNPWFKSFGANDDLKPAPHAWNTVCGHAVDLVAEYYRWNSYGEDAPWHHESFKEYSLVDICKYIVIFGGLDGLSITVPIYAKGLVDEFNVPFMNKSHKRIVKVGWSNIQRDRNISVSLENVVFNAAANRLVQRIKARFRNRRAA